MPDTQCFKKCSHICCLDVVLAILGFVLALTIGVIIGLELFELIVALLPVFYIVAVIFAILLLVFFIIKRCN